MTRRRGTWTERGVRLHAQQRARAWYRGVYWREVDRLEVRRRRRSRVAWFCLGALATLLVTGAP